MSTLLNTKKARLLEIKKLKNPHNLGCLLDSPILLSIEENFRFWFWL